ncbi:jg25719 [Pararge aegeria aegeria]|uniref:Jg25719 protein n=1 Tax=Pararge aegeria aegeria TaxID=348720 RepID=A0A8S4QSM7_9NEOP|nr:jg25719 [Pararge aegeria aegeria]
MSAFDDKSTNKKEKVSAQKQNAKNTEDQYNIQEMPPSADEASYEEQIVEKPTKNTNNKFNNKESSTFLDKATKEERNVANQNKKIVTKQYNIEEMSPFADEPLYKEDIFNKPAVKQEIQT